MDSSFKVGDHVKWNSEAGHVSGKIIKILTTDFNYNGYTHHANKVDAQYVLKNDKTYHVAVHNSKILTKLSK